MIIDTDKLKDTISDYYFDLINFDKSDIVANDRYEARDKMEIALVNAIERLAKIYK